MLLSLASTLCRSGALVIVGGDAAVGLFCGIGPIEQCCWNVAGISCLGVGGFVNVVTHME